MISHNIEDSTENKYIQSNIRSFLYPMATSINLDYKNIISKYSSNNETYIFYLNYLYSFTSKKENEFTNYHYLSFEDIPDDVLSYINQVDYYYDIELTLQSLFRKLKNNYSDNIAMYLSKYIENLYNLSNKDIQQLPPIYASALEDIHTNNKEQLALIKTVCINNLLLQG